MFSPITTNKLIPFNAQAAGVVPEAKPSSCHMQRIQLPLKEQSDNHIVTHFVKIKNIPRPQ